MENLRKLFFVLAVLLAINFVFNSCSDSSNDLLPSKTSNAKVLKGKGSTFVFKNIVSSNLSYSGAGVLNIDEDSSAIEIDTLDVDSDGIYTYRYFHDYKQQYISCYNQFFGIFVSCKFIYGPNGTITQLLSANVMPTNSDDYRYSAKELNAKIDSYSLDYNFTGILYRSNGQKVDSCFISVSGVLSEQ